MIHSIGFAVCSLAFVCFGAPAQAPDAEHALWKSANGGAHWHRVDFATEARINFLASDETNILAATDRGLFWSPSEGREWHAATGLETQRVLSLSVAGPNWVAGTAANGLWVSADGGQTFRPSGGLQDGTVRSLAWDGAVVYAGLDTGEVMVSRDLAQWTSISDGLPSGSQVFEVHANNGGVYAALYSKGMFRLADGSWKQLGEVEPLTMLADREVLIAGHNPGGLFRSPDGGKTWRALQSELPRNAPSWHLYRHRETYFYGTSGASGLYRSRDRGESWEPLDPQKFAGTGVVAMTAQAKTFFAATTKAKLRTDLGNEADIFGARPLE